MTWANYDDVLGQIRGHGLVVDVLDVGTPRPRRCYIDGGDREKRGWYWLNEVLLDVDGQKVAHIVGAFGIYQGNDSGKVAVELRVDKASRPTKDQAEAMRKAQREQLAALKAMRKAEANRAADVAAKAWAAYVLTGESDYLAGKGVGAHGVRFSPSGNGTFAVPMTDGHGKIHGLQLIRGKNRGNKLQKQYWPAGLDKKGHYHLIGSPSWLVIVAEGYATAASIAEACYGMQAAVAVGFDANNLLPVAEAISKRYPRARILVAADDDYLTNGNPGVTSASAAALAVGGSWCAPVFAEDRAGKKITDFNDLHAWEGLHVVRAQIEARLGELGWCAPAPGAGQNSIGGGGKDAADHDLCAIETVEELQERFAVVYEMPETVFDTQEHCLVPLSSSRNICTSRQLHRFWMESREKKVVRVREVGFDPACTDPQIKCNLWSGWPTLPVKGKCDALLDLGQHLCSAEDNARELWRWVLCWLAYPIQNPGAKMHTALIVHGGQGTGKNLFFEAVKAIYGSYGRVIDQAAMEDKFNDWASRKLFMICDEVVAKAELFHIKNKLKALVTGETIRINPKNVGSYEEVNHVNFVILSNDYQPAVLEQDDRRHCVIWTPEKLGRDFYDEVVSEIKEGGVAALHDYLLNLDLAGFDHRVAPMTRAKEDLIQLGAGSIERFFLEWTREEIDKLPACPARSEDLYAAYRHWCNLEGVGKAAQKNTFLGAIAKRPGVDRKVKRFYADGGANVAQGTVVFPPGSDPGLGVGDLSKEIKRFSGALDAWKDQKAFLRAAA